MSKNQPQRRATVAPTTTTTTSTRAAVTGPVPVKAPRVKEPLLFQRQNYILMAIGAALVLLGMICMLGGSMPDANTWDDNIIYSFRIVTLAPILILAGLGVEIYAIFKKA
jgi:Protein of unknown function (DUF3098)